MPVQHSPPARQTRSQARAQAVLTPNPRVPFDSTPEVPQLRAQLGRAPHLQGEEPSRNEDKEKNYVEEEGSDGTESVPAPVGASQGTGGPTLAQYNPTFSHQSEQSLLAIMHQMTQIMASL
ncbi:hypothetical protein O181_008498 [Austropuccinia psidii MF-1]|uniref:Uncharacterized protein n=1 Tax=Austropuccinia psidii MF-1 TaxID=1389203 RepID=A0A9Q3BP89_9BASI|nr:hypothetical protein [Austropuccinia psidii MF-1]